MDVGFVLSLKPLLLARLYVLYQFTSHLAFYLPSPIAEREFMILSKIQETTEIDCAHANIKYGLIKNETAFYVY